MVLHENDTIYLNEDKRDMIVKKWSPISAGWYLGRDRTIYIAGGPSLNDVVIVNSNSVIVPFHNWYTDEIYVTERKPYGFTRKSCVNDNRYTSCYFGHNILYIKYKVKMLD